MQKLESEIAKTNYTLTARIFHWSFLILFVYGVFKQIENINQLEDLDLLKFEVTFALLFILFLVAENEFKRSQI